MAYSITSDEYVEINNVPLHTPAWIITDLSPLWDIPGVRGEDRIIPYAEGRDAHRRIYDALIVSLPMAIFGDFNWEGVAQADARLGLWNNIEHLKANVLDPDIVAADPGTKLIELHAPGGTVRTGQCHVIGQLAPAPIGPGAIRAVLDVTIPLGVLT